MKHATREHKGSPEEACNDKHMGLKEFRGQTMDGWESCGLSPQHSGLHSAEVDSMEMIPSRGWRRALIDWLCLKLLKHVMKMQ